MPLIIKDKEGKKSPHLALTHNELQGGAANGRNVSLLMKNKEELTEDVVKALEILGINPQSLNKAAFYSEIRTALTNVLREKYAGDKEWLYVEDFNDSVVIFCNDKGIFSAEYSYVNGEVTVSDLASPVVGVLKYEPTSGKMLLSEDAEDKLEEGVYSLVTKALENQESVEHFIEVFKSLEQRKQILQEEIQKAVQAAEAILKTQLVEKEEALQKALDKLAEIEQVQKEAVEKSRKEAIAAVEADAEKAAELFKSLESLSDEAFASVVKALGEKNKLVEESDLFVQKSKQMEVEEPKEENATAVLLKQKYAKQ